MAEENAKNNVTKLSENQTVEIDKQKYRVYNGRLVPIDEEHKIEPHFTLVFRKSGGFGCQSFENVDGVKVTETSHKIEIDIYDILKKIFGEKRIGGLVYDYMGIHYENHDTLGEVSANVNPMKLSKLEEEFEKMFELAIVNQTQLKGFKEMSKRILETPVNELYRLLF